jgi:hypothetical protein
MEIVPKSVAFATAALTGFNRNRYRLETAGATSAGPSSIVTITLPSNAVVDLKSLRVHMDLTTTSDAVNNVFAKLPADVSSLIQSCEVYIGGVQVTQSCSEYNTVCRVLKAVRSSRDRDGSVDHLLSHGVIDSSDAVDNVSVVFTPTIGFLGESSTRFMPTSLTGDITIRLTFAPTSVLAFKQQTVAIGGDFADANSRAAAALLTYSASNIFATCDTIALGDAYERMLMDRLSTEEFLPVNFKEYYTFSLHGTTGGAHSIKFNLSASSIDACYAVFRDSNYQTPGIKTQLYTGASFTDTSCANAFYFKSFNSSNTLMGNLRYHWTVANVRYPQYQASILDAAADLSLVTDQVHTESRGHMVTSLSHFNNGACVIPLILNMPGQGLNVSAGYNSKGSSTQMSLEVSGQTPPTAAAATGTTAALSTFVVVETTAQLRISGNRQIGVSF